MFCINKGVGNYTLLNYNKAKIIMEYFFPFQTPYELINYSFPNISFYKSYTLNIELTKCENIRAHMITKKESYNLLLIIIIFVFCIYQIPNI